MEAVGQLTGGIAHDFNNLGNIELLELDGRKDDERLRRLLGSARRSAERRAALTQRLLAFSRRQALRPQNASVNRLVRGMSELLQSTLGKGIEIETVLCRPPLSKASMVGCSMSCLKRPVCSLQHVRVPSGAATTTPIRGLPLADATSPLRKLA